MNWRFTHSHGAVWISWVGIVWCIGLIIFFFGVWSNFLTILESFGFKNNGNSQNAFFWLLLSIWALLCLRGAKVTYTYKENKENE